MATVSIRNAQKAFGDVKIIKGLDLDIADGDFCVFVGPSGCGKSTLLRMIAGLEDFTSGSLQIGGREMVAVEPADRGVAMVSDFTFVIPAVHLLNAQNAVGAPPAYRYRFDYASRAFGGLLGSCHALDLPFVFDNMDSPGSKMFAGEADGLDELAGAMAQSWVNFAATGNPNHEGLPDWAPYNDDSLATMLFNNSGHAVGHNIDGPQRAAWQGIR